MRYLKCALVCIIAASIVIVDQFVPRRIGDHFQIALPLAGLACAVSSGQAMVYLGRYAVLEVALTGFKEGLGTQAVNLRPDGHTRGFPSGHTAAATFGASALVHSCLRASPIGKLVAATAAGFTGGSRIQAGKHYPFQVLFGAIFGWGAQVLPLRWFARRRKARKSAL